jgi:hypothetical protein
MQRVGSSAAVYDLEADMTYLIQAEERDLSFDLLQQLAKVMAESPELVLADATYELRSSHGILAVPARVEAERLSARFAALGVSTFLLDSLLEPPKPELLHLMQPRVQGAIEMAAAASLHLTTERKDVSINPLSMQVADPQIPIPGSSVQETTFEEHDSRYCFDLFTHEGHWRAEPDALALVQRFLGEADLSAAYLGAGVRSLQAGVRRLPTFASERDYDRYLTWLYQLRYATR